MRWPSMLVVMLLGLLCGFLSGCDRAAISDLQQDQADHAHSLGKAWDEIKLQKAELEALRQCQAETDAEPFAHAMNFAQQQFLKCDHRLTELEHAITTLSNGLAKRIEEHRNTLDHTTAKADCAYDNNTALAAKLAKIEERIEKDHAELAAVLKQQDQAIEQLAARKPEPLPAPVANPSPPHVEIIPANSKVISVAPVSCPNSKCRQRNQ